MKTFDTQWDDYLMSILSEGTSRWIVHNRMPPGEQQEKLKSLLNTYHGPTPVRDVELVEDKVFEGELTDRSGTGIKKQQAWKKADQVYV